MSLLATKGLYGLIAMFYIAKSNDLVQVANIAKQTKISKNYLEQLLVKLKAAGLVISQRGAKGGYKLSKSSDEIMIKDILEALEGEIKTNEIQHEEEVVELFFSSCDYKIREIFNLPLTHLLKLKEKLSKNFIYNI